MTRELVIGNLEIPIIPYGHLIYRFLSSWFIKTNSLRIKNSSYICMAAHGPQKFVIKQSLHVEPFIFNFQFQLIKIL